jgi:hypothetical protein
VYTVLYFHRVGSTSFISFHTKVIWLLSSASIPYESHTAP